MSDQNIRQSALEYHRAHPPGKISILPTKQLTNQRDLALAYTPGVAAACDEIVRDASAANESVCLEFTLYASPAPIEVNLISEPTALGDTLWTPVNVRVVSGNIL